MTAEPEISREIKDALNACTDAAALHQCADHYRDRVVALGKDPSTKVFAIQISNLKVYCLDRIRKGW